MKSPPKIFVDSDVVISSLISKSGAAHFLLNEAEAEFYVSDVSCKEIRKVAERMGLSMKEFENFLERRFKVTGLGVSVKRLKKEFGDYTTDPDDAHIIAGAAKARVEFLITYNLRHFRADKVKADFKIISLTPAKFLQYLRSI